MAYIPPNSTIQLFKNIPLNPDYENTYYFHSRQDELIDGVQLKGQNNFFDERATATFTANSYVRKERGVIKLQAQYENVYDCCYMRYRNTSFEYKWFYAFVLKVEYVNNETVEVTFQPDVMQTWLPYVDYDFEQCFIEREHTADDEYFHNLTPENLDYGDTYVLNGQIDDFNLYLDEEGNPSQLNVCMIAGKTTRGSTPSSQEGDRMINGVYCPVYIYALKPDAMTLKLMSYEGSTTPLPDDIIAMYMYPARFGTFDADNYDYSTFPPIYNGGWNVVPDITSIDGYRPYNKKLFNYPYTLLSVSNNNGKSAEFKWEGWAVGQTWQDTETLLAKIGRFSVRGTIFPPATATLFPTFYNKIEQTYPLTPSDNDYTNYDEGLVLDNFPQCPWVSDTYRAWLAQNKASLTTNMIAGGLASLAALGVSATMPYATPAFMAAKTAATAVSVGANVAGTVAKVADASAMPTQARGQIMNEYLNAGLERFKFTAKPLSIRNEFARKIDQYFQMFGYASHEIKKPYMRHREKWWYTKTVGCDIHGSLPADDVQAICGIFDKGIRFWWDKVHIGIYDAYNIQRTPDFPV